MFGCHKNDRNPCSKFGLSRGPLRILLLVVHPREHLVPEQALGLAALFNPLLHHLTIHGSRLLAHYVTHR